MPSSRPSRIAVQSPDLTVSEAGDATLHLERQFDPGSLVDLAPEVAYTVALIDRTTGKRTEALQETITAASPFTGKDAAVTARAGRDYAIAVTAVTTSTVAGTGLVGGTTGVRFDNVARELPGLLAERRRGQRWRRARSSCSRRRPGRQGARHSFTVETDGRLPSEEPLNEAIERVDAETGSSAAYCMVNCAHPTHFGPSLEAGGPWLERLGGIRANASRRRHAELDGMDTLDDGSPEDLASEYRALGPKLPALRVLGGCCGTDRRRIAAICDAWRR